MTKVKSAVVSRRICAKISKKLHLGDFLFLGKGMNGHYEVPDNLLADVFESLVAAIYLDGGLEPAKEFILKYLVAGDRARRRGRARQLQVGPAAGRPAAVRRHARSTACSTSRAPTTTSASRSPPRSPATVIRRPGARTRRTPSSGPR